MLLWLQSSVSGILLAYGLGVALDWRQMAYVGIAIPLFCMLSLLTLPSSPGWLLSRGHREAALKAMIRIRGEAYDSEGELALIERAMEAQSSAGTMTLSGLFQGSTGRAMAVTLGLMTLLQLSGINSVVFFSGAIFEAANYDDPAIGALITGAINVVVTIFSALVVDRFGRRPLLLLSMVGCAVSSAVLGAFFYMLDSDQNPPGLIALLSLMFYNVFFAIGLGPLPWLIASEVLPARARNLGSSLTVLYNWLLGFAITKSFANMVEGITSAGTFWFYAASVIPGVYFALRILPETKGRSLADIEAYFARLAGEEAPHAGGSGPEDTDLAVRIMPEDIQQKEALLKGIEEDENGVPGRLVFKNEPAILGAQFWPHRRPVLRNLFRRM